MKRSFSNAACADVVVAATGSCEPSIVDALPAEMFCEIALRLDDLASLLCLAGTCKFAFVSVFRACNAWDYALPADWDGESIVPVAFFGTFLDAIKDTRKADHDRMVKYILRRDDAGKMPNVRKWLPDFIRNLVLSGGPWDGEEDSLLVFMRDHLTLELVASLETESCVLDPLYLAVVNMNARAMETLCAWTHDQPAPVFFFPEFWPVVKTRDWIRIAPYVDAYWAAKQMNSHEETVDFLVDAIDFSVSMKCPSFIGQVTTFWRMLLRPSVTLDDIQSLPPLDSPIPVDIVVRVGKQSAAATKAKMDHFKKHVSPSLEITYVLV